MKVFADGDSRHVFLDPKIPPAYYAKSDDTIIFKTYDCFSNMITSSEQKSSELTAEFINPATGPVAIEGAMPDDILKVKIVDIKCAETGLMAVDPNLGGLKKVLREEVTRIFSIKDGKINFNHEIELVTNPMIGVIGTAPKEDAISTDVPDSHGGNIDCTLVTKGSTVYLPVNIPGAMLSIGDLHALMGDGEIVLCGMEIAGEVTVEVSLLKNIALPTPAVIKGDVFSCMVSSPTFDEAVEEVVYAMHAFLVNQVGMIDHEAGMLLALVGNLKINQIVNPLKTVRLEIPKKYLSTYLDKL